MTKLFRNKPLSVAILIAGMTLSNFLEGIGFSLVVPLFQQLFTSEKQETSITAIFHRVFDLVGIPMTIEWVLTVLTIAFTLKTVVAVAVKAVSVRVGGEYLLNTQNEVFKSVLSAKLELFGRKKQGQLINALATETVKVANAYILWTQWLSSLIAIAVYVALAVKMSGGLAIVSAILGFTALFPLRWISTRAIVYGRETTSLNEQVQSLLNECFGGIKFIKGGAREHKVSEIFSDLAKSYRANWQKAAFNANLTSVVAQPIAVAVLGIILIVGLRIGVQIADMLVFLIVFQRLMPTISNSQSTKNDYNAMIGSIEKIENIHEDCRQERERITGLSAPDLSQSIELKNVRFQYPDGHKVFENLSLSLPAKKTTALLGQSGGGKTTLVDLILGFYSPQFGSVTIDGVDLESISLFDWRSKISYVSQDVVLFHDTIAENLKWDAPDATNFEIQEAAKLAQAHQFITTFEKGYETVVGDRGFRLSGGQKQRLALARAILKKPKLLILDEATSALDAESERLIAESLDVLRNSGEMTIILIAHRMTTVQRADQIFVIGNGSATTGPI